MRITLIPAIGGAPLELEVAEFIVRQDNGTPIAVGAEYGPSGTQAISMVGMPDFQRILELLGVSSTVVINTLQLPRPHPGARLLTGPTT